MRTIIKIYKYFVRLVSPAYKNSHGTKGFDIKESKYYALIERMSEITRTKDINPYISLLYNTMLCRNGKIQQIDRIQDSNGRDLYFIIATVIVISKGNKKRSSEAFMLGPRE